MSMVYLHLQSGNLRDPLMQAHCRVVTCLRELYIFGRSQIHYNAIVILHDKFQRIWIRVSGIMHVQNGIAAKLKDIHILEYQKYNDKDGSIILLEIWKFFCGVTVYYLYNCVCDRDTCAFVPLYGYVLIDLASLTSYNCNINIIKCKYILFIVIFSKHYCANNFF